MNENIIETDVCILGTGIAGLSAALECAKNNVSVTIITKSDIKESSTLYAQGGIAVAMHQDDTPQLHLEDTLKAGAGHCIPDMVKCLVEEGLNMYLNSFNMGQTLTNKTMNLTTQKKVLIVNVAFFTLVMPQAKKLKKTLKSTVKLSISTVFPHHTVTSLLHNGNRCCGVYAVPNQGPALVVHAKAVILATGGCSQIYKHNTNPPGATGDGIALATALGATYRDMEFVQFHPTTLYTGDQSLSHYFSHFGSNSW